MRKILLGALLLIFSFNIATAQDTVVVQTLDFNDITKRRGWYVFPKDTSYQKILMYYTLKCDAATTQDNYACGEWDYTTYTNLYLHDNAGAFRYMVNGAYPDTINYVNNPMYTYFESYQYFLNHTGMTSETNHTVGTGTTPMTHTALSSNANGKAQYLWQASELITAGLGGGTIDKLKLDLTALGGSLDNLTINMKHTSLTALGDTIYEKTGLTEVYKINTTFASTGINTINLTTPFIWDGTSNIVIEFCFSNASPSTNNSVNGDATAFNSGVYSPQDDGDLKFAWGNYVEIPGAAFAAVDSFVTVSFWAYGDTAQLPKNTYIFEGRDANGYRVLNSHLPWGNSQVYWDAGNSATNSSDRIQLAANPADFKGSWSHWALTKDVSTGEMKVFLNGKLFNSGTGKTKTMAGITDFKIGGGVNAGGRYDGSIHDFRVWNVALDSATINEWMYKDVTASHPNYPNLQAYYKFDDMTGKKSVDSSPNGHDGELIGMPSWKYIEGCDLYRNMTPVMERPNITFSQGVYTTTLDSVLVLDSVLNPQISIIKSTTSIDTSQSGITMTVVDTTYGWESGWSYTYDPYGVVSDSTFINYTTQLINEYQQTTFQLQNYVTPYGIGLDLGPNGFRWVYDVTDYKPLLHDTVELSAGNQQELIDVKFIMIKGTPPREPLKVESIWNGDYQHKDIANDDVMKAVDVDLDPNASSFRIKTRTSGHWFGGFQNCAEFCPKYHNVFVDGVKEFEWLNWKKCAGNPVNAQGGTWVYDRAGWCPGTFTDTYDHELTPHVTPGTTVSLDYGMETTAGGMEGNYRTTMQLVTYGPNSFNLDARVDEIISPNDWEFRSKLNPICADPQVVIQNTGTTTLTSLTIFYNILGGSSESYTWTGSLEFMEKEEVTLPIQSQRFFWSSTANEDRFEVTVRSPNGLQDEYPENDYASTTFVKPDVYNGLFHFRIQTNGAGHENSYTIKDDQGNIVMSRSTMASNTTYYDTLNLADGCYVLDFLDSDDDGMSFFANNDGNGSLRFWPTPFTWVKSFDSEFGSFFKYHFIIDNNVGMDEFEEVRTIDVYPNPSHDIFNMSLFGFENGTVQIEVYNAIGEVYFNETNNVSNNILKSSINLKDAPNGIYFLKVISDGNYTVKRIVKN